MGGDGEDGGVGEAIVNILIDVLQYSNQVGYLCQIDIHTNWLTTLSNFIKSKANEK